MSQELTGVRQKNLGDPASDLPLSYLFISQDVIVRSLKKLTVRADQRS